MTGATAAAPRHKFAFLADAPYRLLGTRESRFVACPGATPRAGSTCDYCGTPIVQVFDLRGADGRTFHVGNECIRLSGDRGLVDAAATAKRAADRASRHAREMAEAAWARAEIARPEVASRLAGLPHPHPRMTGRTRLDWAEWMLAHAGAKGRGEVARFLRRDKA